MNTRVITVRHGEHAWSLRVIIDGETFSLYRSPDDWLQREEADFERKRIARMLASISGVDASDGV